VAVVGDYAYVADWTAGLRVISVSDPAHPVEVGYYDTPGYANGVAVIGDYAYVADVDAGLQMYQFYGAGVEESSKPQAPSLKPAVTIVHGVLMLGAVDSRQNTGYRVELLDVSGRKVLDLHPGPNDVRSLSPGAYFVRLGPNRKDTRLTKLVVTR
jgi:hypothetical protein